ncbi:MAG: 16S rRNA (uracil(1498)-N(3))-methyltransferase [Deltaproteobacteria bacterium]|nr:MAG: 16S rRNA (uracil(1498)-N(3))-methyltransferase [Deltaproteobacteria bacterium]
MGGRHRLLLDGERWDRLVGLSRHDAHKLVRVLRLSEGAAIEVFDGRGRCCPARLVRAGGGGWMVELDLESASQTDESWRRVRLAFSLSKGRKPELVVRMATEAGVSSIEPCLSARSIPRPDKLRAEQRLRRWRNVAREAARQCGRSLIPELQPLRPLGDILEHLGEWKGVILDPAGQVPFVEWLRANPESPLLLLVGPEGGWEPAELALAKKLGFACARMEGPVLRAESAAAVAAALACQL